MFLDEDFFDLIKSASFHKYVKRTGGPGNYKYWYKLPDGRLVSSDDPAASEHGISPENAKKEHLLRLMLGKHHGHHSMSEKQMADHVGVPQAAAHSITQNFRNRGLRTGNHGFEEHHWEEAYHANPEDAPRSPTVTSTDSGEAPAPAPAPAPAAPRARRPRTPRVSRMSVVEMAAHPAVRGSGFRNSELGSLHRYVSYGSHRITNENGKFQLKTNHAHLGDTSSEHSTLEDAVQQSKNIEQEHQTQMDRETPLDRERRQLLERNGFEKNDSGDFVKRTPEGVTHTIKENDDGTWSVRVTEGESVYLDVTRRALENAIDLSYEAEQQHREDVERFRRNEGISSTPAPAPAPAASPAPAPAQTPEQAEIERLRSALRELDPALHESLYGSASTSPEVVSQSQQRAREAKQRAQAAASPSSPEAAELHEADPSLRAADEAIARMEEAQRRGENPYFTRAKEIYNNIRGDLKPERREKIGHILSAIEQIRQSGSALTEQSIVAKYNEITGRRTREFPHDDFEPSTYMTLDEVIANAPLDVEVERMKRGYAAKQFTRLRPYLKDAWVRSNPSAPPPMPTFGDIKSWGEHGGPKPEWAGNTRLAMPREVFDAAVKGADGKVKYPPAWMPLHLMPAWNYIVKKAESAGKLDSEYRGRSPIVADQSTSTGWNIDAGTTAGTADGIAMNALRKYVKMRGGAEQLTDIPKTKLAEMGLSHAEIFKADADSDEGLKQVIRHKIVDPVALLPFIKEEMKSLGVSKSVKQTFSLVIDKSLAAVTFKKENELKKSQLIKKIRALKAKRS